MTTPNPMEALPPSPSVSKRTICIAGLLCDVYGLDELPTPTTHVSVLWLHHPRGRVKEDMADIAAQAVEAWVQHGGKDGQNISTKRALIAVAFDQRNHGSRLVSETANQAWREGNATHAQDMFAFIAGMAADTTLVMDSLCGYILQDKTVDQHLVLGVSLGGHSAWQLMFAEPRVEAAVVVVGCPDYIGMLTDRARLSKLATFDTADNGASFLGSKDFPPALVEACKKYDPKGLLFGEGEVTTKPSELDQIRLRRVMDARIRFKRFLLCSGDDDKLVPYRCAKPFMDFFINATSTWYKEGVYVEDKVYAGVGHEFSKGMRDDALRFIVDTVAAQSEDRKLKMGGVSSPPRL